MSVRPWVLLLIASPLAGQTVTFEGAGGMTRGNYIFTVPTTSWAFSAGLALRVGHVTVRGTLPVLAQNTSLLTGTAAPAGLLPTGGGKAGGAVGDSGAARRGPGGRTGRGPSVAMMELMGDAIPVPDSAVTGFRTHVGDPTFQLTLAPPRLGRFGLALTLGTKAPLTDTAAYGTGAWDVGGAMALSYAPDGRTLLGADVGYWHLGDLPDLDLRNPWMGSVMLSRLVGNGWAVSASAFGSQAAVLGFTPSVAVGAGLLRWLGGGALGAQLSLGLTETAPDVAVSATWRLPLLGT